MTFRQVLQAFLKVLPTLTGPILEHFDDEMVTEEGVLPNAVAL